MWCQCHRTVCIWKAGRAFVKKVNSVPGVHYLELALHLLLRARASRDPCCWNAVTVTEGRMLTTLWIKTQTSVSLGSCHCRLSHYSINILVSPFQICFPSVCVFFFLTHENAQGLFQPSDVALYFVRWRNKPHNSGSSWILKHSLSEYKGPEEFFKLGYKLHKTSLWAQPLKQCGIRLVKFELGL